MSYSLDLRLKRAYFQDKLIGRAVLVWKNPNFRKVFVLAIVPVVLRKYFPKLVRQFRRRSPVTLARLVVANGKAGTTGIAKLKGFDRIRRIFRQFFIQYRYWAVYIVGHSILRWGEESLALQMAAAVNALPAASGPICDGS
jgi:hypothetical protein